MLKSRGGPARRRDICCSFHPQVEKRLLAYVSAAGAVCAVGALASSAQAEVIFTPVQTVLPINSTYHLDLNADGVNDFTVVNATYTRCGRSCGTFYAYSTFDMSGSNTQNGVVVSSLGRPLNLQPRQIVGPHMEFKQGGFRDYFNGSWKLPTTAFVGVKFTINGELHYGWTRFQLIKAQSFLGVDMKITGYAYETNPNQPIPVGKKSGSESVKSGPQPAPASLGHLAAGADAVHMGRHK